MTGSAATAPPEIWSLGEAALLVVFSQRIDASDNARVHALAKALVESEHPGLVDVVPAYAALLVQFDPAVVSERELCALLTDLNARPLGTGPEEPRCQIEVPVVYGGEYGPDLAEVARLHGLSESEVIGRHTAQAYRVYFTGFMPGFAYMGLLPAKIATPRLAVPRLRVPAGSVGIAGQQTGIYPVDSPGGWRIIGRTPTRIWDPTADPPARIRPGDHVRFVAVESGSFDDLASQNRLPPHVHPAFEVLDGGGMVTVQDLGRPGLGRYGVTGGGVMDRPAAVRANALVGNDASEAVLEVTWPGLALTAIRTTVIALEGADLGCEVDGRRVPIGLSWLVRAGQQVCFTGPTTSSEVRVYLAVAGGFDVPEVLGSRSTFLPATFGGYGGRPLRTGDLLGTRLVAQSPVALAGLRIAPHEATRTVPLVLRFVPYLGPNSAGEKRVEEFCGREWLVSEDSNRTGTRLTTGDGRRGLVSSDGEVVSFGLVPGAIQLPPSGLPVILNADHGTTGGYPLLGVMASVDLPVLAHAAPGTRLSFEMVTLEEARGLRAQRAGELAMALRRIRRPTP